MIRQIEDLDNLTKSNGPTAVPGSQGELKRRSVEISVILPATGAGEQDPYAIASAPDNQSPSRNGSVMPSVVTPGHRLPCSNLPIKLFGVFR